MVKQKCVCCGRDTRLIRIFKKGTNNGDEEDYSKKVICKKCLEKNDEYGTCDLCSVVAAYHIKDVKSYQGKLYCKEHYSEITPYDEEEEDDWDSFGEYVLDPSHGGE